MIYRMSMLRTRHQDAVDVIAGWIVSGRYGPGDVLPNEADIGTALSVSRTVVREAMRTLVAKGMVSVRRRHGTQVRALDDWSLFDPQVVAWRLERGLTRDFAEDLVRFRLGIEPYAAGLAAQNAEFPKAELEDAFARMAAAVDGEGDYHEADLDFHKTIIMGSNNQFLRQLVPLMANALRVSISLSVLSMDTARASLPMHRAVADGIINHDAEGASRALARLIESAREDILVTLSQDDPKQNSRKDSREETHAEDDRLPVQAT
jgi:GntR family transcriptional regulator, galactonate operon transcriptional repressor